MNWSEDSVGDLFIRGINDLYHESVRQVCILASSTDHNYVWRDVSSYMRDMAKESWPE